MAWLHDQQVAFDGQNIVAINHFGEYRGRPYFTMALADTTIQTLRSNNPDLDLAVSLEMARLVTVALGNAMKDLHQAGKIHQDIKPSNILVKFVPSIDSDVERRDRLLMSSDKLWLADLGLAMDLQAKSHGPTGVGTFGYMPPEGYNDDPRARDLFSATVVVYYCLVGRVALGAWHRNLRQIGVAQPLIEALEKGLDLNPSNRYASAVEWSSGLLQAIDLAIEKVKRRAKRRRMERVLSIIGALSVVGLIGVGVIFFLKRDGPVGRWGRRLRVGDHCRGRSGRRNR